METGYNYLNTKLIFFQFVNFIDDQALPNAYYGRGTGPIVLNSLQCVGNENQLLACGSSHILSISHNCGHDDDAGIRCTGINHFTTTLTYLQFFTNINGFQRLKEVAT